LKANSKKEKFENLYSQVKKASKGRTIVTNEVFCEIGTSRLFEIGQTSFKRGDFYLVDVRQPSKNIVKFDTRNSRDLSGHSV